MTKLLLCVFVAFFAAVSAFSVGEWDEGMYEKIRIGRRAAAVDDATGTATCGKHYTMKKCECQDPQTCDGSWIRSSEKLDECVVWTRAAGGDGKVRGAVPVATCVRLMIDVEAESERGENPSVRCPDKFARVGCNLHTFFRQAYPETMGVTQSGGACQTYGDCDRCKVQAICIRNKDA